MTTLGKSAVPALRKQLCLQVCESPDGPCTSQIKYQSLFNHCLEPGRAANTKPPKPQRSNPRRLPAAPEDLSKNSRKKASQGLAAWLPTNCQEFQDKDSWLCEEPEAGAAAEQPAGPGLGFQECRGKFGISEGSHRGGEFQSGILLFPWLTQT